MPLWQHVKTFNFQTLYVRPALADSVMGAKTDLLCGKIPSFFKYHCFKIPNIKPSHEVFEKIRYHHTCVFAHKYLCQGTAVEAQRLEVINEYPLS